MKKKEAKKRFKEIIKSRKKVFCPIARGMCRTDCEFWKAPVVKLMFKDRYGTPVGYCRLFQE